MKLKLMATSAKYWVKGHKNDLAMIGGATCEVAAVVLTAKATIKAKNRADQLKKRLDIMWAEIESLEVGDERELKQKEAEKVEKKEIRACVRQCAKDYALPAVTLVSSLVFYSLGAKGYRREIRGLSGALAAEIAASKLRKERAKKMLTEDQFNELYYGLKKSDSVHTDKDGNEIVVYERCIPVGTDVDGSACIQNVAASKYAMLLNEETCGSNGWWSNSWDYDRTYIRQVEDWANSHVLRYAVSKLNEVRKQFDLEYLDECEDLGNVFKPERANAQVSFDIYEIDDGTGKPCFLVDVNYENIRGKIAQAIRDLNAEDVRYE